jgi:hypothetical protein
MQILLLQMPLMIMKKGLLLLLLQEAQQPLRVTTTYGLEMWMHYTKIGRQVSVVLLVNFILCLTRTGDLTTGGFHLLSANLTQNYALAKRLFG